MLCISVVDEFRAKTHHRDTEDTEVAQRKSVRRDFCKAPARYTFMKVNIEQSFDQVTEHWSPKVIGSVDEIDC